MIKAVARELMDAMYMVLVSELSCIGCGILVFTLIGSLVLPVIFPQTTVCRAKVHVLPFVCISVQVTVVWLVIVGQLPQFDARML